MAPYIVHTDSDKIAKIPTYRRMAMAGWMKNRLRTLQKKWEWERETYTYMDKAYILMKGATLATTLLAHNMIHTAT